MKTCGYCGRENEDSAIACRECGLSEFPETAEEKVWRRRYFYTIYKEFVQEMDDSAKAV